MKVVVGNPTKFFKLRSSDSMGHQLSSPSPKRGNSVSGRSRCRARVPNVLPSRPQPARPKNPRNTCAVCSGSSSGMKCPAGLAGPVTHPAHRACHNASGSNSRCTTPRSSHSTSRSHWTLPTFARLARWCASVSPPPMCRISAPVRATRACTVPRRPLSACTPRPLVIAMLR